MGFALTVLAATATATGSALTSSCLATRVAGPSALSASSLGGPRVPPSPPGNRWLSKALATRGGSDEGETMTGVLSEIEIAVSSFQDIVGGKLVTVDDAKKGTTKEVQHSEFMRLMSVQYGSRVACALPSET